MPISPISSHDLYPSDLQDRLRQGNRDFQRLAIALESSDLAGAQKALAALKQDIQNIQRLQNQQYSTQLLHIHHPNGGAQAAVRNEAHIGTILDVIV